MKTLAQNIRDRMKAIGMTQKELAERAEISQVMVHKLVAGKVQTTGKLLKLAAALRCTAEELQYGEEATKANRLESNAEWAGGFELWDSDSPLGEDEVEIPFYMEVELSAGEGIAEAAEHKGPKLRFAKSSLKRQGVNSLQAACVKVNGNSMEPVLPHGSTVGVDTSATTIVDGKMYAINHDGMMRVKMLYKLPGGGMRLRSYNLDEYPDERLDANQLKQVTVIGKVFWYSVLV
ncbi:XRE family transcriptional regulator [Shewanella sp. Choline-02u-19]|uniref:XRE family transcriptional regulator n=1 Tax=unclassified Shewanella TaxID=196818 RepID=UPI000C3474EA|nr:MULTISPECIES: helix-turn-helix transcriptional regulator [unclassified Shewanella]PKH62182.1 XRE family transcriptional regulator [Shewanella sp. Bg11-22]PKI27941.1 XRE family transcriptional regulator [Shewanella sp. Choline-02u-19]